MENSSAYLNFIEGFINSIFSAKKQQLYIAIIDLLKLKNILHY
jgi:hypothetical protein